MPAEGILVLWQFETDTPGVWQEMDRATSDLLEAAFRERPDGEITIHSGESLSYNYNLRDMQQLTTTDDIQVVIELSAVFTLSARMST